PRLRAASTSAMPASSTRRGSPQRPGPPGGPTPGFPPPSQSSAWSRPAAPPRGAIGGALVPFRGPATGAGPGALSEGVGLGGIAGEAGGAVEERDLRRGGARRGDRARRARDGDGRGEVAAAVAVAVVAVEGEGELLAVGGRAQAELEVELGRPPRGQAE